MRDGRALQMGTSHHFGQNFTRAFDVQFLDRDGERKFPHSTSWAVSTRLIGALVLVHGDEKGLILPPRIAPVQVVVVPIWRDEGQQAALEPYVEGIVSELRAAGIRVEVDWRDTVRPGFKFNDWELRGVPLRLEIGPRDLQAEAAVVARRDTGAKETLRRGELVGRIPGMLEDIQGGLLARARHFLQENTGEASSLEELRQSLEERRGFYWVPWCGRPECEDAFAAFGATIRLIPIDAEPGTGSEPCVVCGQDGTTRVLVARSY